MTFKSGVLVGVVATLIAGTTVGFVMTQEREALVSPTDARGPADAYYPNSETLAPDEMRVISCGTGMPTGRESQAAACFLVELGNGDKFLFDSGTGSHVRIASLEIPYDFLDKIFISHLHTDHFGDFAAYYIGGWVGGRSVPLNVWGPSGPREDLGTEYALTHWKEALAWDRQNRVGRLPAPGGELDDDRRAARDGELLRLEVRHVIAEKAPVLARVASGKSAPQPDVGGGKALEDARAERVLDLDAHPERIEEQEYREDLHDRQYGVLRIRSGELT